jgi:hypothetical protein
MTTTTNKGYTKPAVGADSGVWGTELNADWDILDSNLGGLNSKSVAGNSNVVATAAEARSLTQRLTGVLTGNIVYSLPVAQGGVWVIDNQTTGAFTVTANTSGGTGIVVPQGTAMLVYSDATNMYPVTGKRTGSLVATITGTTTNDNAATGLVGEYVSSSIVQGAAVTLVPSTPKNVTSISLTAGDWDVNATLDYYISGGGANATSLGGSISTVSATQAVGGSGALFTLTLAAFPINTQHFPVGTIRLSIAATTTVYLVSAASYTVGLVQSGGFIGARRAR